jgi:hypothetical protein
MAAATPEMVFILLAASPRSSGVTGPLACSTNAVIGESVPAGKFCLITLKPSTLGTDFLKKVVLE